MRPSGVTSSLGESSHASPDRRSRLLFLSPVVPAPLDRGQNVRIHNLVLGLARQFRVTLVVPDGPELDTESVLWDEVDELVAVPASAERTSVRDAIRFMVRHRTVVRRGVVSWLQPWRTTLDTLPMGEYSAIWVERLGLARLVNDVAGRVVVDLDDLEHRKWWRELRLQARVGMSRALLHRLYYAVRFFVHEVVLARRFGICAVASASDVTYLRRWRLGNSALLPNGADVQDPRSAASSTVPDPHERGRLVFLGNLAYAPNVDGLSYLQEEIRPALDRLGVQVDITVVGPGDTAALRAEFPGIDFRGFVPDLASALRDCHVCIVPLRLGGGTKLKVLDAMATGTPVVTTSVGAEGLLVAHGVHVLIADSADDFARSIERVLADAELSESLSAAAHRLVEKEYSWRSVQDKALALVSRVAG